LGGKGGENKILKNPSSKIGESRDIAEIRRRIPSKKRKKDEGSGEGGKIRKRTKEFIKGMMESTL